VSGETLAAMDDAELARLESKRFFRVGALLAWLLRCSEHELEQNTQGFFSDRAPCPAVAANNPASSALWREPRRGGESRI
jgi:hypothetical protein